MWRAGATLIVYILLIGVFSAAFGCEKKVRRNVQRRLSMFLGNAAHTGVSPAKGVHSEGELLWSYTAWNAQYQYILADEDSIFYVADARPRAIDRATGKTKWGHSSNMVTTGPMQVEDNLVFGIGSIGFLVIDRKTGGLVMNWHASRADGGSVTSHLTASGDSIYFGTGYSENTKGYVYSVDIDTWKVNWKYKTGGQISASPSVENGTVYAASGDGKLYALDDEDGDLKWTYESKGPLISTPVIAGGLVLFRNEFGNLTAVNANTGELEWNFVSAPVLAATPGVSTAAPAVTATTAFYGDAQGNFYAVDARSGAGKWQRKVDGGIFAPAIVADGLVYFTSTDRHLYVLDAATGDVRWTFATKDELVCTPFILDEAVAIIDKSGTIYAIAEKKR